MSLKKSSTTLPLFVRQTETTVFAFAGAVLLTIIVPEFFNSKDPKYEIVKIAIVFFAVTWMFASRTLDITIQTIKINFFVVFVWWAMLLAVLVGALIYVSKTLGHEIQKQSQKYDEDDMWKGGIVVTIVGFVIMFIPYVFYIYSNKGNHSLTLQLPNFISKGVAFLGLVMFIMGIVMVLQKHAKKTPPENDHQGQENVQFSPGEISFITLSVIIMVCMPIMEQIQKKVTEYFLEKNLRSSSSSR